MVKLSKFREVCVWKLKIRWIFKTSPANADFKYIVPLNLKLDHFSATLLYFGLYLFLIYFY